jgi:hypothetical protein
MAAGNGLEQGTLTRGNTFNASTARIIWEIDGLNGAPLCSEQNIAEDQNPIRAF